MTLATNVMMGGYHVEIIIILSIAYHFGILYANSRLRYDRLSMYNRM